MSSSFGGVHILSDAMEMSSVCGWHFCQYFAMLAAVSKGHEERNPALMAASRMALVGEKRAACMKCIEYWRHFVV